MVPEADTTMQSPLLTPSGANKEQQPAPAESAVGSTQDSNNRTPDATHEPETADGTPATGSHQTELAITVQKRRRVTRACDECRRKKIKCDGKQPCTHCTVYSYECTYDKPSNRRRNPAPQYIEALECRLQKAESLLRALAPEIDLDDPRYDGCGAEDILNLLKKNKPEPARKPEPKLQACSEPCDESLLESMVDNTGSLDLDDEGHWDYHGHSSGLIFVRRVRKQIGNIVPERPPPHRFQHIPLGLQRITSTSESPIDTHLSPVHDLPSKEEARKFCTHALEDACCIMRFLHKPSFWAMFDRIYDIPLEQFSNEENTFLPLLYLALAVGCLFRGPGDSTLEKSGYESAVDQGFQYFKAGRQLLDITECRDLTSLQAVCFMILFLQASANIRTCYSYIGIALRAAVRLGLHRSVSVKFNPIELETRKRIFWVVRKMDVHVSTILGLPSMLSEDDIDQAYPAAADDEYITKDGIMPMPPNYICLMEGANAHMKLGHIMLKVMKYIYPVKVATHGDNHTYMVSHSKIRELERDLQNWMEALPDVYRPGGEAAIEVERMRQLLRICYAHVQMVMYRPFLHYVTGGSKGQEIDKRSYACAAACVSVARNVVHITAGMKKKQLLNGSYWFTMYTTYFAILTLLFFILENPESAAARDGILKDALEGKNALAGLAKKSMAADRCAQSLSSMFKYLPERLRNRQALSSSQINKKRTQTTASVCSNNSTVNGNQTPPLKPEELEEFNASLPQRANTFPLHTSPSRQAATKDAQSGDTTMDDTHASPTGPLKWTSGMQALFGISRSTSQVPSLIDGERTHLSSPSTPPVGGQGNQQQQQPVGKQDISFSPPFNSAAPLPDLMPMMFPSDDPFAYPNQPMSTLEDDHFKQDNGSKNHEQFIFRSSTSIQAVMDNGSTTQTTSSSSPSFANTPGLSIVSPSSSLQDPNSASTLPPHMKAVSTAFPGNTQSPTSEPQQNTNNYPFMGNPDLVTIPGQSFMWQSLAAQGTPNNPYQYATEPAFQAVPDDFGMDLGTAIDMSLDTDMKFDNILDTFCGATAGNGDASGSGNLGSTSSNDWVQWGNWDANNNTNNTNNED
ncbi:transcriptional regulator [Arthroderma uncinatum]|uniref:transcriptional regulator n=1 Tax=Arthroderma uncinatum TaxID=74035 RepID=UPI00144AD3E0|nr:transcriptional regulator [Arthroderma uncinatum]KAF3491731.1 transcriptional regulator [Arthroderma uncinatum]